MARRGYGGGYSEQTEETERTERTDAPVVTEEVPVDPDPEKTKALADLENYYAKVMGDLDREERESHAVHDATEKRCAQITEQRTAITAEYEKRKAEIEGAPEAPPAAPPATRWGASR